MSFDTTEHCRYATTTFKNRLDKYWSTQELVYNYKAKLSLDRKSAGGQIDYEDLDIVAAD